MDKNLGTMAERNGISKEETTEIIIAANIVTEHLFAGVSPKSIGRSPYMPEFFMMPPLKASTVDINANNEIVIGGSKGMFRCATAAGSIALYSMHAELILWIRQNDAAPNDKFINGEFYPGMGGMRQDLMENVVTLGETERLIGVSASGNSLLRPRKSQCSFLALGASEHEAEVKMEPCKPCNGKRCLYYQLGGCHMMTGK